MPEHYIPVTFLGHPKKLVEILHSYAEEYAAKEVQRVLAAQPQQAAPAGQAAAPRQNCGDCRNADSWGIPLDKTCQMTCRPTPEGGSRYVSINAKQAPAAEAVQPAQAVRLTDEQIDDCECATLRGTGRAVERAVWEANNLRGE